MFILNEIVGVLGFFIPNVLSGRILGKGRGLVRETAVGHSDMLSFIDECKYPSLIWYNDEKQALNENKKTMSKLLWLVNGRIPIGLS